MTESDRTTISSPPAGGTIFRRILVGVDGTAPSFEACRQAARLAQAGTEVEAIAVVHLAEAAKAGPTAPRIADELEIEAFAALAEAARILGNRSELRMLNGFVAETLLREAESTGATLVALGSHGHHRLTEILIGGVAGEVLHHAPRSVLVARAPSASVAWPRSVAVGVDGSPGGDAAHAVAAALASRFGVPLRVVTAEEDEDPVDALVDASRETDLVVVGSRGLKGLAALGSVSERVAHRALCSVLVVRTPHER